MLALIICAVLLVLAFAALPGGAKIIGKRDGKEVVQLKSGDRVYLTADELAQFQKTGEVPVAPKPAPANRDGLAERVFALEQCASVMSVAIDELRKAADEQLEALNELLSKAAGPPEQEAAEKPPKEADKKPPVEKG